MSRKRQFVWLHLITNSYDEKKISVVDVYERKEFADEAVIEERAAAPDNDGGWIQRVELTRRKP